jgi:uncharacterized phage protein gp47/JayE
MAWTTPTLKDVRKLTRDNVTAYLSGAVLLPNSVLRIMADAMAGLAHLVLLYIDWLSKQLLPDTAEREWLDRHANIWLKNADGSVGRKAATLANGTVTFIGNELTIIPLGTALLGPDGQQYETTEHTVLGVAATECPVRAVTAGSSGNLEAGVPLSLRVAISGVNGGATVVDISDGADEEDDYSLRVRVLERIQKPPMGGDADDYVAWTKSVPGVTRAWSYPLEQGMGTVTVRFMMDDLREGNGGIPFQDDVDAVQAYLDTVRPVCVKDFFVVAPIPQPVDFTISGLVNDDTATHAAIEAAVRAMLAERAMPGQTIYRSWIDEAISQSSGEDQHELTFTSQVMPSPGHLPVLGSITYA